MRYLFKLILILILTMTFTRAHAQSQEKRFDIGVEPVAYLMDGASLHAGYHLGSWRISAEWFQLQPPESIHGNTGFTASQNAVELKVNRYFRPDAAGFFVSAETGLNRQQVTHRATGESRDRLLYVAGARTGYRWNTGLGNLYVTPLAGLVFKPAADDIELAGETFESKSLQPYGTVNFGWTF